MAAYKSSPTVTRPANQTAYTAGDVVGGAIFFSGMPQSTTEFNVLITSCDLRINVTAVPSGMTSFRLHLYRGTPASALADNAAWDLSSGDRAAYAGYVDLGSPVDVGSSLYVQVDQVNRHVQIGDDGLYGYLVTNGGFTPAANSEVYVPSIRALVLK